MAEAEPVGDPQTAHERRECCRHLLLYPLTCAERHPDEFVLIRRHHQQLDQWFTQRFGYRLHVDADTARLTKSGIIPEDRPLRTRTDRAMSRRELQVLALLLACTAAGPLVVSLRDLVADVRTAAIEADTQLAEGGADRRALVTALRWMIDNGLVFELHEAVDRYVDDDQADAVLRVRPDRIALVPVTGLLGEADAASLLERADRRESLRQWARCHLAEDPALYRSDLTDPEWAELRRRLREEAAILEEMFGLHLETRLEGLAAIDAPGALSDIRFPATGTVSHCALLLAGRLRGRVLWTDVVAEVAALVEEHRAHWGKDYVASPEQLGREAVAFLVSMRLARVESGDRSAVEMLPAASRFRVEAKPAAAAKQGSLL